MSDSRRVYPALLKYWRLRRGLSQLDLALAADVSSRHVSFLETGRSRPSPGMILRLAAALDVPMREQNAMLREEGHASVYDEPRLDALADPAVEHVLDVMLRHHDPYPMMIVDRGYEVLRLNESSRRMLTLATGEVPEPLNLVRALFDPDGFRPFVPEWETIAGEMIARLHRETLREPHNERLAALLDEIRTQPGLPDAWHYPDFSRGTEGALPLRFQVGTQTLSFVAMMTAFQAPQNITLAEVQIESYYPADAETEAVCREWLTA